jgi:anti-sigma-K factor RskA
MTSPSREELRELLGAYALDALDADEREQVDALLLTDADARAELHELEHATAWLGHASLRPPTRAWDAIAAEIVDDTSDDTGDDQHLAPVVPIAGSRRRTWAVAAAAALVLVVAGLGGLATVDRSSGTDTVAERAQNAAARTGARRVQLTSADGRWSARAVVLPDGTGYVRGGAMPAVGPDRDLQLWSITPGGPVSAGVMPAGGGWHEFQAPGSTTALAVTRERAGGSAVPTGTPVVSGDLAPV